MGLNEICTCDCHRVGRTIMHAFACCNLCYDKYLTEDGEIMVEKLKPLISETKFQTLIRHAEEKIERGKILEEIRDFYPTNALFQFIDMPLEELRKIQEDINKR